MEPALRSIPNFVGESWLRKQSDTPKALLPTFSIDLFMCGTVIPSIQAIHFKSHLEDGYFTSTLTKSRSLQDISKLVLGGSFSAALRRDCLARHPVLTSLLIVLQNGQGLWGAGLAAWRT